MALLVQCPNGHVYTSVDRIIYESEEIKQQYKNMPNCPECAKEWLKKRKEELAYLDPTDLDNWMV